jgi:hypothetical protein
MERKARYLLEKAPISLPCTNEVLQEAQIHRFQVGFFEGGWHGGAVTRLQRFLPSHMLAVPTIKKTRISWNITYHPSAVPIWKTKNAPIQASAVM